MNRRKSYSKTRTVALYNYERKLFYVASAALFIALFSYLYFICTSVSDVVMRKAIDTQIASREKDISALELRYIQAKEKITENDVSSRGFAKAEHKTYITRSSTNLTLLLNDES